MKRLGAAVMALALVAGRVEAQDGRLARLDRRVQKEVAALMDSARSLGAGGRQGAGGGGETRT